jgi:hypothetical protein
MKRKEISVDLHFGRRDLLRAAAVVGVAAAAASVCTSEEAAVGAAATGAITHRMCSRARSTRRRAPMSSPSISRKHRLILHTIGTPTQSRNT